MISLGHFCINGKCNGFYLCSCMPNVLSFFQDTDQEDQTCLEEFQECIEEYQECLEVVQICIDEDSSFNQSPCTSHLEDSDRVITTNDFKLVNSLPSGKTRNNINLRESDVKTNLVILDNQNNKISVCESGQINLAIPNDSSTQSDKVPSSYHTHTDDKDGYETCIDESLSEDLCAKTMPANRKSQNTDDGNLKSDVIVQNLPKEDGSKRRSTLIKPCCSLAASEPCLTFAKDNHILLDSKLDTELKSYDRSDSMGTDEFFLIQYPPDHAVLEVTKCGSEPATLDQISSQTYLGKPYRRRLQEYYNDFEHCKDVYLAHQEEGKVEGLADDDIFRKIVLPLRSYSAPDILDSSFVTLTYDPGPERTRRKSALACRYEHRQDG